MCTLMNPLTESVEHGQYAHEGLVQHLNLEPRRHLGLNMGECLRCLRDDFFKEVVNALFKAAGLGGGDQVTLLNVFVQVMFFLPPKAMAILSLWIDP
jgi:hypothetical protein